jgi:formylglycine-generating enzyme required for sulfatase activity
MTRRAALLTILLLTAVAVRAEDPEPLRKAREAVRAAEAELARIEKEMIRAYQKVQADFKSLRGAEGPQLRRDIAELVRAVVRTTPAGEGFEESVAQSLHTRLPTAGLLSAPVAERFSKAVAERIARFRSEPGEASEAVLDEIFQGSDIDRIWDTVFIDIDTVVEWRRVNVELAQARLELDRCTDEEGAANVEAPAGMVLVPAGKFTFGPHDAGWPTELRTKDRARQETLPDFYIDRHEVTNRDYAAFVARLPAKERAAMIPATWTGDPPTFPRGGEQHPVTGVTFVQASEFARARNARLPTEKEWEKAARGPDDMAYYWPWGDTFDPDALVWGGRTSGPALIMSKPRDTSPFRVSDMAGNVAEWTTTLANGKTQLKGIPAATDEIVIRGGSYKTQERAETRTTYRWVIVGPNGHRDDVGFRCVVSGRDR